MVEAKKLVADVRLAKTPLDAAREGLRRQLVYAMRFGHMLVVRMANSAADFKGSYCAAEAFPIELFDPAALPTGEDLTRHATFSKVLHLTAM